MRWKKKEIRRKRRKKEKKKREGRNRRKNNRKNKEKDEGDKKRKGKKGEKRYWDGCKCFCPPISNNKLCPFTNRHQQLDTTKNFCYVYILFSCHV